MTTIGLAQRFWIACAVLAAALLLPPGHAAAQGPATPMQLCQVKLSKENAAVVFENFRKGTGLKSEEGGIAISTEFSPGKTTGKAMMDFTIEGSVKSSFDFQKNDPFKLGMIKGAKLKDASIPVMLRYDLKQQMLTAMAPNARTSFTFDLQAAERLLPDAEVLVAGKDNIQARGMSVGSKEQFGFRINEERKPGMRKLDAMAFGLPALIEPVLRCSDREVVVGSRLRLSFQMTLDLKTGNGGTTAQARELVVTLVNNNDPMTPLRSVATVMQMLGGEALSGPVMLANAPENGGLLSAVRVSPKVPGQVVFVQTAELALGFRAGANWLSINQALSNATEPICAVGGNCQSSRVR